MKLTAEQKLTILANAKPGERHALETLWGIGGEFYAYLFQCFKMSQKEGLGIEYDKLKSSFPDEEKAYEKYLTGGLTAGLKEFLEETINAK